MWFLSFYVVPTAKEAKVEGVLKPREFLFDTEQDLKAFVKEKQPVQYSFKYIKRYIGQRD